MISMSKRRIYLDKVAQGNLQDNGQFHEFFLRQVFAFTWHQLFTRVSIIQKLVHNLSPIAIANYTYICNEFRVIGKLSTKYYVFTEVYEKLKMN